MIFHPAYLPLLYWGQNPPFTCNVLNKIFIVICNVLKLFFFHNIDHEQLPVTTDHTIVAEQVCLPEQPNGLLWTDGLLSSSHTWTPSGRWGRSLTKTGSAWASHFPC